MAAGNPRPDPMEPLNMSADPAPEDAVPGRLARLGQPKPYSRDINERQHVESLLMGRASRLLKNYWGRST